MKNFKQEFYKFRDKIKNHENFAISRANDGEYEIVKKGNNGNGNYINLLQKGEQIGIGEFIYDPNNKDHYFFREKLIESLQYSADSYYIAIGCPCCIGKEHFEELKKITQKNDDKLSFGNLFVNSNHDLFLKEIIPLFNEYKIVLVCNHKANIDNLPFKNNIEKCFRIGTNAWMNDYKLIDELNEYIQKSNDNGKLYLFCAGPFSNLLIYNGFKINHNNIFLDLGSTLDLWFYNFATRLYLAGYETRFKTCVWN